MYGESSSLATICTRSGGRCHMRYELAPKSKDRDALVRQKRHGCGRLLELQPLVDDLSEPYELPSQVVFHLKPAM